MWYQNGCPTLSLFSAHTTRFPGLHAPRIFGIHCWHSIPPKTFEWYENGTPKIAPFCGVYKKIAGPLSSQGPFQRILCFKIICVICIWECLKIWGAQNLGASAPFQEGRIARLGHPNWDYIYIYTYILSMPCSERDTAWLVISPRIPVIALSWLSGITKNNHAQLCLCPVACHLYLGGLGSLEAKNLNESKGYKISYLGIYSWNIFPFKLNGVIGLAQKYFLKSKSGGGGKATSGLKWLLFQHLHVKPHLSRTRTFDFSTWIQMSRLVHASESWLPHGAFRDRQDLSVRPVDQQWLSSKRRKWTKKCVLDALALIPWKTTF